MPIPSPNDPVWMRLVTGQKICQFECLAVKIFLGGAKLRVTKDPSPESLKRLAEELRSVFVKNEQLPSVQKDLSKLAP